MRGIDDPVEVETRPAEIVHGLFEPDARIEKKLPRRAGDDERERERIEIDRPQNAFAADLLIEQDRQRQAEREAEDDIEPAENAHVDDRGVPVRRRIDLERPVPKLLVVRPADELGVGERFGIREGQKDRPKIEAVNEDQDQQKDGARTSLGSEIREDGPRMTAAAVGCDRGTATDMGRSPSVMARLLPSTVASRQSDRREHLLPPRRREA